MSQNRGEQMSQNKGEQMSQEQVYYNRWVEVTARERRVKRKPKIGTRMKEFFLSSLTR